MRLNICQTTALRTYQRGEFDYLIAFTPQALLPREIKTCGDSLVPFILNELSNDNDCDGPLEGARRLFRAAQELFAVAQRLQAMTNIAADRGLCRVTWTIDVVAADARTAALQALAIQRNTHSIATHFEVLDLHTGETNEVDLGLTPLSAAELREVTADAPPQHPRACQES